MGDITKLEVWQDGRVLVNLIYKVTSFGRLEKDFGLRDQMRRSAVSVVSNIAEGEESGREKKSINYFYISKGSLAELFTQVTIASDNNLIKRKEAHDICSRIEILSMKLRKLIQYRESKIKT